MVSVLVVALIGAGQFYLYRTLEPALIRVVGRTGARRTHYALLGVQLLILALLSLDNNWPFARPWPQAGPFALAVSLGAGIWIAGWSGASALLLLDALLLRRHNPGPPPAAPSLSRRRFLTTAARATATLAPFGVAAYGALVLRSQFQLREVAFPVRGLPAPLHDLRIALLTDIHFGPYLSLPELRRVVEMANETRPHLTLVTGDLITRVGDPLDACLGELARLRAEAGVFGCLGNHEIYADCEDYTARQARRLGIEFLRSQTRLLRFGGAPLNLAGVDYQSQRQPYLRGAGGLLHPGAVNLLMSHNPDVFPVAAQLGYDLVVGGHTHGGQVTVEILEQTLNVARFFTPFVAGLYRRGAAALYVSRGVGTLNLPLRLGAAPEVTLLRLRPAESA